MGEFGELGWLQVYQEIPVITKVYTTASLLTTVVVNCELISPYHIYLNPRLVFERFEVWRLLTAFLYAGPFNFSSAFNLLFTYRYCRILEETSFQRKTADFFLMLLLLCLFILMLSVPLTDDIFLGNTLTHAILYLWCRRNPFQRVMIFGLLTLYAVQVPFVLIGLCLLTGTSLSTDLVAVFAGHIYFFLEDVFPQQPLGFRILKTPKFLKLLFDELDEEPFLLPPNEDGMNMEVPDQNQEQAPITPVPLMDENDNEAKSIQKDEPQPQPGLGPGVMNE